MPIIDSDTYYPSLAHRNGHLGTLIPHIFYHRKYNFQSRQRIETPDNDFLDIDLDLKGNDKVAFLCHGLEGSSSSNYILNAADVLSNDGYDIIALNYRGCSGSMNNTLRLYHSGATDDIDTVIKLYTPKYQKAALVGFSLGANMALKYAGETQFEKPGALKCVVGISAPNDLGLCSDQISRKQNYIYAKRFLISLFQKVKLKAGQFPNQIDLSQLKEIRTVRDFDNYYTGPIHGFENANHYYRVNSSKSFLSNIKIPSLIINAMNDPFLHKQSHPFEEAAESEYVHLLAPKYGGHVGFCGNKESISWSEMQTLNFINKYISN